MLNSTEIQSNPKGVGLEAEDFVPPSDEGEGSEFFDGGSEDGGSEDLEEDGNEDQEASSDEGDSQFD